MTEGLENELWRRLFLRHSSFSNPSVASLRSQLILQLFFGFSYVTGSSLTSHGEPPILSSSTHSRVKSILSLSIIVLHHENYHESANITSLKFYAAYFFKTIFGNNNCPSSHSRVKSIPSLSNRPIVIYHQKYHEFTNKPIRLLKFKWSKILMEVILTVIHVVNFGEVRRTQLAKSTLLTSTLVPLGSFQIFKICSDAKKRVGCEKRETTAPIQFLVKLQPWFMSLRRKTCLRQNCNLGSCTCSEGPALGQNTDDDPRYFFQTVFGNMLFNNCKIFLGG